VGEDERREEMRDWGRGREVRRRVEGREEETGWVRLLLLLLLPSIADYSASTEEGREERGGEVSESWKERRVGPKQTSPCTA